MFNWIITADLHLVDSVTTEYRWEFFDFLQEQVNKNRIKKLVIAGDFTDRKDRHTGRLVNRIIANLDWLMGDNRSTEVLILMGNHDASLTGEQHYWEFLEYNDIEYITQPTYDAEENVWLLPFSPNPVRDWGDLTFNNPAAIIMHQPVQGAFIDEYRKIEKTPILPKLPSCPTFSGDIHRPQTFNNIVYVGSPYPVIFGENFNHRILLVKNSDFAYPKEIPVPSIKRAIVEISSPDELRNLTYKKDDQLRIRVRLNGSNLSSWPIDEQQIRKWADEKEVILVSIEPILIGDSVKEKKGENNLEIMDPDQVLRQYAAQEKLSDDVTEMGLSILNGT